MDNYIKSLVKGVPDNTSIIPYGSRVYGTQTKNSDVDLIIILPDNSDFKFETKEGYDVHLYYYSEYEAAVINHEVWALEAYFTPFEKYFKIGRQPNFNLDKHKLRESFSKVSSNSWVKAKKKLTLEKDFNELIGKKSLFHSIRIKDFGIQIATFGKIVSFKKQNFVLESLLKNSSDWKEIESKWKVYYNELSSEFRKVCPIIEGNECRF